MGEYYVFNSETKEELFSSSDISVARRFAETYSRNNCVHLTISHRFFTPESYINGQKSDVQ